MEEQEFEKRIKTIDTPAVAPKGLKERVLQRAMRQGLSLNPFEKFIFERPLYTAGGVAVFVSGLLWAILGNGFALMVSGFVR